MIDLHCHILPGIDDGSPDLETSLAMGAWMQITAGSPADRFGPDARYWAERMLDEGRVHIIVSDGHSLRSRPPVMSEGFEATARRLGEAEARNLVLTRPQGILDDTPPHELPALPDVPPDRGGKTGGWLKRLFA